MHPIHTLFSLVHALGHLAFAYSFNWNIPHFRSPCVEKATPEQILNAQGEIGRARYAVRATFGDP